MNEQDARNKLIEECLDAFFDVGDIDRRLALDEAPADRSALVYRRQVAAAKVADVLSRAGTPGAVVSLPHFGRMLMMEDDRVVTRPCTTAAQIVCRSLPPAPPEGEPAPVAVVEPRPVVAEAVAG